MPANYPLPSFHFSVAWGTKADQSKGAFSEVTGLTQEVQPIEYRHGLSPESGVMKQPGQVKFNNIVLKRGVVTGNNDFYEWFYKARSMQAERRDVIISLLNDSHMAVMSWTVHNAFPVKLEGPQFKASGNEVAIESLEIAHEGLDVSILG